MFIVVFNIGPNPFPYTWGDDLFVYIFSPSIYITPLNNVRTSFLYRYCILLETSNALSNTREKHRSADFSFIIY